MMRSWRNFTSLGYKDYEGICVRLGIQRLRLSVLFNQSVLKFQGQVFISKSISLTFDFVFSLHLITINSRIIFIFTAFDFSEAISYPLTSVVVEFSNYFLSYCGATVTQLKKEIHWTIKIVECE